MVHITDWMFFFGDQGWFYLSARNALLYGQFPLLGITSSITWLHQGPLWTYLLIPTLGLSGFNPVSGSAFTIFLGLLSIPLIYLFSARIFSIKTGLIAAFALSFWYFPIFNSRLAYHTSPLPLFSIIFFLMMLYRKSFLSGLFMGFLYQLHLLTVIFWPFALWFLLTRKFNLFNFFAGLLLGTLPFILSGPIQSAGVFFWLFKFLSGHVATSGLSVSYKLVLLIPFVIFLARMISFMNNKIIIIFGVIFFILNISYLFSSEYFLRTTDSGLSLKTKIDISQKILRLSRTNQPGIEVTGGISGVTSYKDPYTYLIWWLQKEGSQPAGKFSRFQINELSGELRVIE